MTLLDLDTRYGFIWIHMS